MSTASQTLDIRLDPQPGEPLWRAAEVAVAGEINRWDGWRARVREARAHGGDVDACGPGGRVVIEVRSLLRDRVAHDGILVDPEGFERHFARARNIGAARVVLVAGHIVETADGWSFRCGAIDASEAVGRARRAQASTVVKLRFPLNHSDLGLVRDALGAA